MVAGCNITEEDRQPIAVDGGTIDHVSQFQYLGSVISDNGQIDAEIYRCTVNASKAFGALIASSCIHGSKSFYYCKKINMRNRNVLYLSYCMEQNVGHLPEDI